MLLKSILVIAILLSCGLGSSLVQIVAWATMIPDQLDKTGNIVAAIENTFDGNHPCPMCKLAAELRPAEQEPEQPGSDKPNNRDSERKKSADPYYFSNYHCSAKITLKAIMPIRTNCYIEHLLSRSIKVETPPPQFVWFDTLQLFVET